MLGYARFRVISRLCVFAAAITLSSLVWSTPLYAQFKVVGQPNSVAPYATVNVFLHYEARETVPGLVLEIPIGWEWYAGVKRSERGEYTTLKFDQAVEGRIRLKSSKSIKYGDTILLQFLSSGSVGKSSISVSPFVYQGSSVLARSSVQVDMNAEKGGRSSRLKRKDTFDDNKVGSFGASKTNGWMVHLPAASALASNEPYTLTMWVQTTETNQVLLSTWTGDNSDDYPIEWVVDPAGFLEFYRGFDSKHVSMRSTKPVADGNWHFFALVHDPENEWSKLAVDGVVVDSLYHIYSFANRTTDRIALGSRLAQSESSEITNMSGFIDDFRLSPTAWNPGQIAAEMAHPSDDGSFVVDFQERPSNDLVVEAKKLNRGTREFDVSIELSDDLVVLEWETFDAAVLTYRIERSFDGQRFNPISEVPASPSPSDGMLSYTDMVRTDGVVYYRITPLFESGPGKISPVLKIGKGEETPTFTATLTGNFPNPFNPSTTISYDVIETQHIRISVWDLSGQMLTILADGTQSAGHYEVPYSANDLPSGTYFVRMESDSGIQTHQILLMK